MDFNSLFGNMINFKKHESSYFNLPASIAVIIAYMLPGVLNLIYSGFSYFATLILIGVAAFEKKSRMVRLYCLQFCFYSMFFNILLTVLTLLGKLIPLIGELTVILSLAVAVLSIVVIFYSLYRALQYKYWKMPVIGEFIMKRFVR